MKRSLIKTPLSLALAGIAAVGLSGCVNLHNQVDSSVEGNTKKVSTLIKTADSQPAPVVTLVSKVKGSWVSAKKPMMEAPKVDVLPEVFATNFVNTTPGSIRVVELMSRVSREKGVQIRLSSDLKDDNVTTDVTVQASGGTASSVNLPALPGAMPAAPVASSANGASSLTVGGKTDLRVSDLNYNGTLTGFIDLLASKMQVSWKYENGQVTMYKYDTKVFNIKALAGIGKVTSGVGATTASSNKTDGGASSSTVGGNRTDMVVSSDLWKGVQESVKVMLSPYGKANFYAAADLGTITISDAPERLDRVTKYLETLNKDLSKQVALNIVVYNIEIDEKDTVGVDWTSVWNNAAAKFGLSLGGLTSTGGLQNMGVSILKGDMADSKFVVGALNSVGKTSLVTRGQIMTMNRQTAPLQVVDETSYLAKVTTTVSGTSGTAQQSLEPGTVITGFSTMVTPKIEDDGDVLLQFAGGISDLKSMTNFTIGGNTIQLPQKSIRDFLQRVKLRSGETLVLAGFEQNADRAEDQGVGHSKNILMGGKQMANAKRTSVVVLVTPYVMQ